ncbi:MAG: PEGA domain-containing protein [Treponema sp.]|jgi:hypothetical protein|nr:PEGA domain-containing protein [Treponema sp.]
MYKAALTLGAFLLCVLFPLRGQVNGSSYSGDISGDRFEELEGRGFLIRTRPAGARVFIDGLERGLSPLFLDALVSGEYRVRLSKEGYRDREFTVYIPAGSRLSISIEMEEARGLALLLIRREGAPPDYPFSPGIFVDGVRFTSWTPVKPEISGYTLSLPAGRHSIRVGSFGWEDAVGEILVRPGETVSLEMRLNPAPFRLFSGAGPGRTRFNPASPGALGYTDYRFGVSAPGAGVFRIFDREGKEVYTEEIPPFKTASQRVIWNGRDSRGQTLPDGDYTLVIEAAPEFPSGVTEEWRISAPLSIDSSISHYPLTLFGAVSGLLFSPLPMTLPQGGFQVEGNVLFGRLPDPEGKGEFSSLPLDLGFRFSPLEGLELAAALEAIPVPGGAAEWGFSLSPKWRFFKAPSLEAAAAAGFSWSSRMDLSPRRGGASFHFPLSWAPAPSLSLILAPGLYWRQWREGSPRPLLGAGILYRFAGFSAGLSLRQEYRIHKLTEAGEGGARVVLLGAAELKWQPPRTNLVFTLLGGFRHWEGENAGFGGLGMGAVY